MSSYLKDYTIQLTADGLDVNRDFVGSFLLCTYSSQKFEMSFDGQTFFTFNQGLRLKDVSFKKLWFRALVGVDTTITIYVGDVQVDDSRLNIIHDANQVLSVGSKIPATYLKATNQVIGAGASLLLPGADNGNQRKDILIFNLDAAAVLTVQTALGATGAVVWPQDNLPLETSDTVKLQNDSGAGIAVTV
jgi:hypothetical protein